jgi:hypothetical protein
MTAMDPNSLPPLYESVLDAAQLDALFCDVGLLQSPVQVQVKGAPTERASDAEVSLSQAKAWLDRGIVRAVQLRYVHEGVLWCDTLIQIMGATRLVRSALPTADTDRYPSHG